VGGSGPPADQDWWGRAAVAGAVRGWRSWLEAEGRGRQCRGRGRARAAAPA
jgi:hypothetical protein